MSLSPADQQDCLRRIQRKASGVVFNGPVAVVTRPNGTQLRVTFDASGMPTQWEAMR